MADAYTDSFIDATNGEYFCFYHHACRDHFAEWYLDRGTIMDLMCEAVEYENSVRHTVAHFASNHQVLGRRFWNKTKRIWTRAKGLAEQLMQKIFSLQDARRNVGERPEERRLEKARAKLVAGRGEHYEEVKRRRFPEGAGATQ